MGRVLRPTSERHVPYRVRQAQIVYIRRTSGPFAIRDLQNDGRACEAAEWIHPGENLNRVQMSGKSAILPPPMLGVGKDEDQPLSRPYQKKKCPLLEWLCPLPEEPPARPTPRYIPSPSLQERSPAHE